MKLVNLTPHCANIYANDDTLLMSLKPSGTVARCTETIIPEGSVEINGMNVEVGSKAFGEIQNLPEPDGESIYFVSALVATAAWAEGRTDVVCPLKAKRDEQGRTVGTYGLAVQP